MKNLLQIILNRAFNFLEWGLNSPPKPHGFTSCEASPIQSNFFSIPPRFINIIKGKWNETFFYTVFLVLFFYLGYRFPTQLMLSELDLLVYFPLINIAYSICCIFCICHVSNKELTKSRLGFVVISGLSIPLMIYLFSGNYNELRVCICSALASVLGVAIPSEGPVIIEVWKRLTLYKNGDSNASTPPPGQNSGSSNRPPRSNIMSISSIIAGQNSGSSNRPSRSNIMSISSIIAGSAPATGSSHGPVSGSAAAGTSGSSDSNAGSAAAGIRPQPASIVDGYTRDNMSDDDLNNKFGPIPPKEEVDGILNKLMAQKREIDESNKNSIGSTKRSTKSIFGNYSPEATLSPKDIKGLARMLLGEDNRFIATVRGNPSNPKITVMKFTGGKNRSIQQSNDLLDILRKNNR